MNLYQKKKSLPLDDVRTTLYHREIIQQNPFLKAIYSSWYNGFKQHLDSVPPGPALEVGSGGGFCKEIIPEIITSDIQKLPDVDVHCKAESIPMQAESLSAIFMVNVLHHVPDASLFFQEAQRVLKPHGIIYMIEPARTLASSILYRFLHHEPYVPNAQTWAITGEGPLSGANIALPWIIFRRDIKKFRAQFPDLLLEQFSFHTPFRYLLSGGVSRPSFVPHSWYPLICFLETLNTPFVRCNAMFNTIVVRKNMAA
jgi:SAM-dependent methyltransferase